MCSQAEFEQAYSALLPGQKQAVLDIVDSEEDGDMVVIAEAAGSGKAYIIDALTKYYQHRHKFIVVLWGTSGQAAVVI